MSTWKHTSPKRSIQYNTPTFEWAWFAIFPKEKISQIRPIISWRAGKTWENRRENWCDCRWWRGGWNWCWFGRDRSGPPRLKIHKQSNKIDIRGFQCWHKFHRKIQVRERNWEGTEIAEPGTILLNHELWIKVHESFTESKGHHFGPRSEKVEIVTLDCKNGRLYQWRLCRHHMRSLIYDLLNRLFLFVYFLDYLPLCRG